MWIEFDFDNGWRSYACWMGKYTIGDVSFRGTRVWFRHPHTISFDCICDSVEEICEMHQTLEMGESMFPFDMANLHEESLQAIIDGLEEREVNPEMLYHRGTMAQLKEILDTENPHEYSESLDQLISSHHLFFDEILGPNYEIDCDVLLTGLPGYSGYGQSVFFMHAKKDTIEELKDVLVQCNSHGVKWEWI